MVTALKNKSSKKPHRQRSGKLNRGDAEIFLQGDHGVHGEPSKITLHVLHELPVKKSLRLGG
jgi:hypothetical protein